MELDILKNAFYEKEEDRYVQENCDDTVSLFIECGIGTEDTVRKERCCYRY